jgi:hypothetical protein
LIPGSPVVVIVVEIVVLLPAILVPEVALNLIVVVIVLEMHDAPADVKPNKDGI